MYFVLLVRAFQLKIARVMGVVTVAEGIGTGWIRSYLLLNGDLHT